MTPLWLSSTSLTMASPSLDSGGALLQAVTVGHQLLTGLVPSAVSMILSAQLQDPSVPRFSSTYAVQQAIG